MSRRKAPINRDDVEKLAALFCTTDEIAAFFGVHKRTIERRFASVLKNGRDKGKISLKRKQYELATGGNVTMLIWLGKQHLGQKDRHEVSEPPPKPVEEMTDDELAAIAAGGRPGTPTTAGGPERPA